MADSTAPEQSAALEQNATVEAKVDEDIVDPWNVQASSSKGIDYDKLIGEIKFSGDLIWLKLEMSAWSKVFRKCRLDMHDSCHIKSSVAFYNLCLYYYTM